jgi:hypothetical protein
MLFVPCSLPILNSPLMVLFSGCRTMAMRRGSRRRETTLTSPSSSLRCRRQGAGRQPRTPSS